MEGKPDTLVSAICQEEKRAIITLDTGFANIYQYPPQQFSGIIVLRLKGQDKNNVLSTFLKVMPLLQYEPLAGKLWIVDEMKTRIKEGQ